MIAISQRPKAGDLEKKVDSPPTQLGSFDGKSPPPSRPTYQGPDDGNNLFRDTKPFVLGTHPHVPSLQQDYHSESSSQGKDGKDSHPYDLRN
ncbi:hypothetical protein HYY73_05860 [Candidatus Woesearchaeota archaeon]|nr:hypothetical protein [Candidatus Woesearchaeota archaeon]